MDKLINYLTFKFNQWNRLQTNHIEDVNEAKAAFKAMLDTKDQKLISWMREFEAINAKTA